MQAARNPMEPPMLNAIMRASTKKPFLLFCAVFEHSDWRESRKPPIHASGRIKCSADRLSARSKQHGEQPMRAARCHATVRVKPDMLGFRCTLREDDAP